MWSMRRGPASMISDTLKDMNYYGAAELAEGFRTVRKNTLIIAEEIGEQHYGFRATPDTRTIAQTLVHIAIVTKLPEQILRVEKRTAMEGFDFLGFRERLIAEEQVTRDKAQIVDLLRENGDHFAAWFDALSDDFLAQRVSMPPGATPSSRTRFEMLLGA